MSTEGNCTRKNFLLADSRTKVVIYGLFATRVYVHAFPSLCERTHTFKARGDGPLKKPFEFFNSKQMLKSYTSARLYFLLQSLTQSYAVAILPKICSIWEHKILVKYMYFQLVVKIFRRKLHFIIKECLENSLYFRPSQWLPPLR